MENLEEYYTIIEESIRRLGIDPLVCRGEQQGQWNLMQGSASVWIDLWHIERQGRAYYQVMSPVMQLPDSTSRQSLYEELLQLNDKLFGVGFSLYKNLVWMKTIREARGMDVEEALNILTRIATYADMYDDYLIDKYNGTAPEAIDQMMAPGPPATMEG